MACGKYGNGLLLVMMLGIAFALIQYNQGVCEEDVGSIWFLMLFGGINAVLLTVLGTPVALLKRVGFDGTLRCLNISKVAYMAFACLFSVIVVSILIFDTFVPDDFDKHVHYHIWYFYYSCPTFMVVCNLVYDAVEVHQHLKTSRSPPLLSAVSVHDYNQ